MTHQGTREDLVALGLVLASQLNRMTKNADLAVMQEDPIVGYHQANAVLK